MSLTATSLSHPTTKAAIRTAAFEAAVGHNKRYGDASRGTSYVQRKDGGLFMRIDHYKDACGGALVIYGPESRNFYGQVRRAMGKLAMDYLENLCNALASPATEKQW